MGAGEAGKTSMLRRLRDLDAAVLPDKDDRTIGLEIATMALDPANNPEWKLVMCGAGRRSARASRAPRP